MISLKGPRELEAIRHACRMASDVMAVLAPMVQAGITTQELDDTAARAISALGGVASFKGYRGYPCHICVSVNEEIIHGVPGPRALQDGDVVSVDLGVVWQGWYSDVAYTISIPPLSAQALSLIEAARQALDAGVGQARAGARVGDISSTIQSYVETRGYSVIREYVGHGIGTSMHEDPQIPNFGQRGQGPRLKAGMVLCIEPMVAIGGWKVKVKADRWTAVTADGTLSAHFEQTVLVTNGAPEILTDLPDARPSGSAVARVPPSQSSEGKEAPEARVGTGGSWQKKG